LTPLREVATFVSEAMEVDAVMAPLVIRALFLAGLEDQAEKIFVANFSKSSAVQQLVAHRVVPPQFLIPVRKLPAAAQALLDLLSGYATIPAEMLATYLDGVFAVHFVNTQANIDILLPSKVVADVLVHICGTAPTAKGAKELRLAGAKVFALCFLSQKGFLNLPEGVPLDKDVPDCLWDSDKLDIALLDHVVDTHDNMHLARRVLLRYLLKRRSVIVNDYTRLSKLWPLGRWEFCEDAMLIRPAFDFLKLCYKVLRTSPQATTTAQFVQLNEGDPEQGPSLAAHTPSDLADCRKQTVAAVRECEAPEEVLFAMFASLEFWRLPLQCMMSPWVPAQVLSCYSVAQHQSVETRTRILREENAENVRLLTEMKATVAGLTTQVRALKDGEQSAKAKIRSLESEIATLKERAK